MSVKGFLRAWSVTRRADFAWEITLSGLAHVRRLQTMKPFGYHAEIIYLLLVCRNESCWFGYAQGEVPRRGR
jgi:hypothetical protein